MKLGAAHLVTAFVCALAGSAWAAGDGKACLEGVAKACVEIGTAVANDEPPVGDVDQLRADCEKTKDELACAGWLREEVKAGCRHGKPAACRTLGEGEARRLAEGTAPTTEALEASCKKKDQQSCIDLALRLIKEEPSKQNQKRALALLDRSCKAGLGDGCARLGMLLVSSGKNGDAKRGLKLMKHACELGSTAGCIFENNFKPAQPKVLKPGDKSMGPGLLQTDDVGQVMKNLAKLAKLLEQNCKLGYADACAELSGPDGGDPARAEKTLTSAEIAEKIRKLEKQAAAGPAPGKK